MKNKICIMLVIVLMMLSSVVFASNEAIEVKLNDKYIDFTDEQGNRVEPTLMNSRTMVPMRKIFESLGADVQWDGATQKVTATTSSNNGKKEIVLQIDNVEAIVTDVETQESSIIKLDAAPVILDGRTMVPVRFIAESLNKQVGWDAQNRVVVIIDYDEVVKDIEDNCSTFMGMIREQTVEINSIDSTISLKGNLVYKDSENSKNNEKLTAAGTINVKKSGDLAEVSADLKISGKGTLYDALKESKINKVTFDIIANIKNGEIYLKSSLLETDKWVKSYSDELSGIFEISPAEFSLEDVLLLPESSLTKDSFDTLTTMASIMKSLLGNDKTKVSGSSSKTYTIKWELEDILRAIGVTDNEDLNELLSLGKATLEISSSYKNGMTTKTKYDIDVDWQAKDTKERFTVDITGEQKINSYNKNVKITLPKASEVVENEDSYVVKLAKF